MNIPCGDLYANIFISCLFCCRRWYSWCSVHLHILSKILCILLCWQNGVEIYMVWWVFFNTKRQCLKFPPPCQEYELKSTITTGIVVAISTFSIEKILSSLMSKKRMYLQGLPNQDFLEYYLLCLACHESNSEPKLTIEIAMKTECVIFWQ